MSNGEEFLKDNGLIEKRSARRRQVLACLACRWADNQYNDDASWAYGYQIIECSKIKSGVLYPLLRSLEDTGVVSTQAEDLAPSERGRPPRRYYTPADTELGHGFRSAIEVPVVCYLPDEQK